MENNKLINNVFFSTLKTIATILIPFVTFPYISRVLGVESIGKWNYATAVESYFLLFGAFGINEYAVRNGAQLRREKKQLQLFASQIFSVNWIFSGIAFLLMIFIIFMFQVSTEQKMLLLILSFQVLTTPLAIDWFYSVVEDFQYVSLRTIVIQLCSAVLTLMFVKSDKDVVLYALIVVLASFVGNICNYKYSRKYSKISLIQHCHFHEHAKNAGVFFLNSLTSTIYLNSDVVLLGWLCNDYTCGLYSVATKIYYMVKQVFNAAILTIIPRLSDYAINEFDKFHKFLRDILNVVLLLLVPASFGMALMRKDIIILIAGKEYLDASAALGVLSFAIFFAVLANIFANGVMLARGMEKYVMRAALASAMINVLLNFVAIPTLQQTGTAITTLIAEVVMLGINLFYSRDILRDLIEKDNARDIIIATLGMIATYTMIACGIDDRIEYCSIRCAIKVLTCMGVYLIILLIRKNQTVESLVNKAKKRI